MLVSLDHVIVAVADLPQATRAYATLLGRSASWRGSHPALGTENTLFRLDNTYLELLAPAGDGALADPLRARLARTGEGIAGLAFGTDDAERCAAALRARALPASDPQSGLGRDDESGAYRQWRSVWLPPEATRGLWLFAIEHGSPAEILPPAPPLGARAACVHALDHVVVASGDLPASATLFGDGLGLRLALDRAFPSRALRILFFRVGGVTVEIVGALDPEAGPSAAEDRLNGLAWRVDDVDGARLRLADAGVEVSELRPGHKPGTRVCSVRSGTCGVPTLLLGAESVR